MTCLPYLVRQAFVPRELWDLDPVLYETGCLLLNNNSKRYYNLAAAGIFETESKWRARVTCLKPVSYTERIVVVPLARGQLTEAV